MNINVLRRYLLVLPIHIHLFISIICT